MQKKVMASRFQNKFYVLHWEEELRETKIYIFLTFFLGVEEMFFKAEIIC